MAHDIRICSHFCTVDEKRNDTFSRDNVSIILIHTDLDKLMLLYIAVLLNRLATKSEKLVGSNTTNIADLKMNLRSKFDGG